MVFPERIFEHLQSEFFAALGACRKKPRPKAVHALRASARRLQALLGAAKLRRPGDAKFARKADKALKSLKPVRSAAGPVRDMDAQRDLLAGVVKVLGAGTDGSAMNDLTTEIRQLEAALKKRRKAAATELMSVIRKSEQQELRKLSLLQTYVFKEQWKSLLKDARDIVEQSTEGLDPDDTESLHQYRKRTKNARYLAEMEEQSATAERFAKRVKKVLDAIGRWHDCMLLTDLAGETLGKSSTLSKYLKKERDRSLRVAVRSAKNLK
jgi:CHAD domain-containing protein